MPYGYKVENDNTVVIWADEDAPGRIVQPTWPDGTPWTSKSEAEDWAEAYIAAAQDDTAPRAGNSPDKKTINVTELELSAEEKAAIEAARAAEEAARAEAEAAAAAEAAPAAEESEEPTEE